MNTFREIAAIDQERQEREERQSVSAQYFIAWRGGHLQVNMMSFRQVSSNWLKVPTESARDDKETVSASR